MIVCNLNQLSEEITKIRDEKTVVLVAGTFDLFHPDHLAYLKGASQVGDIVVAAVKSNKCAALKAPNRPIIDEKGRIEIVDAIKYVHYSILVDYDPSGITEVFEADNQAQREWLTIFQNLFSVLRPDFMYHEDNPVLQTARERVFEKYGVTGIKKKRGEEYSTTQIIAKLS